MDWSDIHVLFVYFILLMSVVGFVMMGIDKRKAMKRQVRVSERTLWITAFFGGAFGMTCGMYMFRHKTKHATFKIGLPALFVVQLVFYNMYMNQFLN